jgi:C4-dicarboxylate-specific signal transduction histidine kinase
MTMRGIGLLRDLPIQRKLAVITMLTSGLALLLVGLALVGYEQAAFRAAMLDRLSLTASMVADNSAAALTFNDPASAAQTLRTLGADQHIVGAAIYNAHGKVFATYQRPGPASGFTVPAAQPPGQRFEGPFLRLFRDISLAGERAGAVYIQSDLTEMHARVWRYAVIMVLVLAAASAAAMLLARRLHVWISGPVSHLAQVVDDVTHHKNYAVRAVKESDDELGRLIAGFNAMLSQIQAQGSALQQAHDELEKRVAERTHELQTEVADHKRAKQELERIHRQLVDASRQAGMAEIATNVLHNVGNVLNSVNVSALLAADLARKSKVSGLGRVVELMRAHEHDLASFVTSDPRGQHLIRHLGNLAEHLKLEQDTLVRELESVRTHIEHIKDIVAMQQNYAKVAGAHEIIAAVDLVEDSLRMNEDALHRHRVEVVREFASRPQLNVDKHKVLQILVNLVRNAKNACEESSATGRRVTVGVQSAGERVRICVADNGVGIAPENMTRIFNHGFTTRAAGHGFGLHSGALAARELGGTLTAHSEGVGRGATFVLELPLHAMETAHA